MLKNDISLAVTKLLQDLTTQKIDYKHEHVELLPCTFVATDEAGFASLEYVYWAWWQNYSSNIGTRIAILAPPPTIVPASK